MKNFLKITTLLLLCCCWTNMFAQVPCEDCLDQPFDIVCVIDDSGETIPFPNACWAECEGYTDADFVDCGVIGNPNPDPCDCEFTFEPVCVEDDEGNIFTFPNACFAECEGYTEYTECDDNPFPVPCPDCEDEPLDLVCVETAPGIVCAFPNLCYAECEGYTIDQVVECDSTIVFPSDCDCEFDFDPVCVEDDEGNVFPFPNACWAECEGYTDVDFVDCDSIIIDPNPDPCDCEFTFEPVCVEDDEGNIFTFPNACFAECEGYTEYIECDDNPFPTPCPECEDEPLETVCVETAPGIVCAFPNLCYAECEGYTIDQVVECDSTVIFPSDCDCDFEVEIVCVEVEEGVVIPFPNACWAECEGYTVDDFVDCDDIIVGPTDCNCTLDFDPVCVEGDDGEIYPFPNACWAECEGFTADDFVDCEGNNAQGLLDSFNYPTTEAEILDKNELNLVQNPVQNRLTMNFDLVDAEATTLQIRILSIGGDIESSHVERAIAGENQVQIDVSDLKSGVYFLQVQTKTGVQTVKFIK